MMELEKRCLFVYFASRHNIFLCFCVQSRIDISLGHLHLRGVCVFQKTRVNTLIKKKKLQTKRSSDSIRIQCVPLVSKFVKHRGACRHFGNEILAVLNVVCKICEQLRNTRIQIYSYRSNRFYLVLLMKLTESISISGKLENKKIKTSAV